MTFDRYINPDFTIIQKLIFLGIAAGGILVSIILIALGTKFTVLGVDPDERRVAYAKKGKENVQLLYEMVITGTCAIFFAIKELSCDNIFPLKYWLTL